MKFLSALVLLSLAVASAPANAQRKPSLADRVAALEQSAAAQGNSVGQQNLELVNRLAQMQAEVQALRNQVETLQNENEQLKQRGREQYVDLDTRLQRVEGAGGAAAAASAAASVAPRVPGPSAGAPLGAPRPASGAGGDEAYAAAFAALKRDDFVESARAFQVYLREYPQWRAGAERLVLAGRELLRDPELRRWRCRPSTPLLSRFPDSTQGTRRDAEEGLLPDRTGRAAARVRPPCTTSSTRSPARKPRAWPIRACARSACRPADPRWSPSRPSKRPNACA